jgi:MYXO-CTERM domain-containing protein
MRVRRSLVFMAALVGASSPRAVARAQDATPTGGEPITSVDPTTLAYDYLVDGTLAADDPDNRRFTTVQAAYAAAPEGTADRPTVIGIVPNVYLLPGGGSGASLSITKSYITLLGLTNNRRDVVLADNRGNAQGASDNGYVIIVNATGFTARNLTILNYCNADYQYPGDPTRNLSARSSVITQAVALQAQGDKHVYDNVALLSRLDTMFLQTTRSYFRNVFIEGTDDFIGGGSVSAWEDSQIYFPTGSGVMSAANVAFINSTFNASSALEFSKSGAVGVALIDCVMAGTGSVAWVRGAAPPRPNQYYVTYRVTDGGGNPLMIADGTMGASTYDYSWELSAPQALAFNPWNLLRAPPTGAADDWDPAGARDTYEGAGAGSLPFRITLSGTPASIRTGAAGATIGATVAPARADQTVTWSTPSSSITLSTTTGPEVVVTGNETGAPEYVPVVATASNGFHATAWIYVEPPYVDPPVLTSGPTLSQPANGTISVDYAYDLAADRTDQSVITWSICSDATCASARDVAVSRDNMPLETYTLTPGDVGNFIRVGIQPKHNVSDPGPAVYAVTDRAITACDLTSPGVSPNFQNFVTDATSTYVSGLWSVLGTWTVQAGTALVNGYGIRAGSQGAALLYQEDTKRGDMQVTVTMTPEKTSGAGFGSPGSGADGNGVQKADILIKYDPRTQTGYSLRFWRTTQSTSSVMFQLYRIDSGAGTPLNDMQVLNGVFRYNATIVVKVTGDQLTVDGHNDGNAATLSLQGTITPSDFGGAGVAWYGTVSRGNSNVYSRIDISYPGAAPLCPTITPVTQPPAGKPSGGGCGCATGGGRRGAGQPLMALLLLGILATRARRP